MTRPRPDPALPRTAAEVFRLGAGESILYGAVIGLARLSGRWRHPVAAEGDLERMTFLDKAYWLHKAARPLTRARRGSGLEALFEAQGAHRWSVPDGLAVERSVTVSSAGDLISHPFLARSAGTLHEEIADLLFGADVPMANLECVVKDGVAAPLTMSPRAGPPLVFDRASFDAVKGHAGRRFAFLAAACNHSLDLGPEGVDSTIRALRDEGIAFHGVNAEDEDALRATVLEVRGVRLGVVSYTFGLNARRPPPDRPGIVNRMDLNGPPEALPTEPLASQLAHCRAAGVDFVIAHLHWGLEHEHYPTPEQLTLGRHLAELGVDAILGHHPHVIQPAEWYRTRRDPHRVVPIFYSLGNLVNPFSAPFLCRGRVARLELVKGTWTDGTSRTYVGRAELVDVDQIADPSARRISLRLADRA